MKTSTFRTFFIGILVIAILVLLAAWGFLVFKSYSYRAEITSVKNDVASIASRDSYLSSIRNVLHGAEGDLATIETRFITEDGVPEFINFLEGEAEKFGVKADLGGIAIDPVPKNGVFKTLRVRINASGEWKDLVSLMHRLDTVPYALRVERAGFSKGESSWNLSLDITQYVR